MTMAIAALLPLPPLRSPFHRAPTASPAWLNRADIVAGDRLWIITEAHFHRFRSGFDRGQ